ncbi:hypothetical protein Hypma_001071 [Hypsizygus marmoreus]|uniref:MYND-type domain-containing protein n=1 Tax=Hypsizygus marmoreus TaxID=39966 RepID=A0A369JBF5_HYPMA|nr:hypothetical protein Hypma_001071 [Hypsizygus marmoreus]
MASSRTNVSQHLQPLSSEIKALALRAATSVVDLNLLGQALHEDQPLAHYPELLNVIFQHFERRPPPNRLTPNNKRRIDFALAALMGTYSAARSHLLALGREDNIMLLKTRAAWPAIWTWMEYLYYWTENGLDRTFNAASRPASVARYNVMDAITRALYPLLHHPSTSLAKAILATPNVLVMVTEMMVRQSERPQKYTPFDAISPQMQIISVFFREPAAVNIRHLVSLFRDSGPEIASQLVKPVHRAAYGRETGMACFGIAIRVCSDVVAFIPETQTVLLAEGIMFDVFYGLTYFSSVSEPNFDMIGICVEFIRNIGLVVDDITWIVQAIRLNLIQAMLRCAAWPAWALDVQVMLTFRHLRLHLAYRSMLKPLERVMNSSDVASLESKIPRDARAWTQWLSFREAFNFALKARELSDVTRTYSLKCNSHECTMVERTEQPRLCAACGDAAYCSSLCQKLDWKEGGHRVTCNTISRSLTSNGKHAPLSSRNLIFLGTYVDQLLMHWCNTIREQRGNLIRSTSHPQQASLIVLINEAADPHERCMVMLASSFDSHDAAAHGIFVDGSKRLRNHDLLDGQVPLIQPYIKIPRGKDTTLVMIPSKVSGALFGWL